MSEKIFKCMQEVPNLHKNYSSGAIVWGFVHPIEENILLLNNIGIYNYTAVYHNSEIFLKITFYNIRLLMVDFHIVVPPLPQPPPITVKY